MSNDSEFELKGWHVLAGLLGAFAVILIANFALAFSAVRTFPGMSVQNSYVASQEFDEKRQAQEELGWRTNIAYQGDVVLVDFEAGNIAQPAPSTTEITIGRPATDEFDQTFSVEANSSGRFEVPISLDDGEWMVLIEATAENGVEFEQRHQFFVRG